MDAAVATRPSAAALTRPIRARSEARSDRLALALVLTPLVATTVLAKWATPVGPPDLGMSWPLILGAVVLGWVSGRLRADPVRCAAYLALVGGFGVVQVVRGEPFSLPSLLLMSAIFGCYVVSAAPGGPSPQRALDLFLGLCGFIALVAVAQFLLQFVVGRDLAFPVENLLPRSLLIQGYNNQIPLDAGTTIQKANGVFLLEPSFLSQLMAVAIVAQLGDTRAQPALRRVWRLAVFGAALYLSYSGTGLLVLAVALPVLVIAQRRWSLMLLAVLAVGASLAFHEALRLDIYLERATEFTSMRSSGFERFVSPFLMFEEFLWRDPWRTLFGIGAGSYLPHVAIAYYPAAEMAYSKIVFEYGVVGAAAAFGFLMWAVFRCRAPLALRVAVIVMFLMSGLYTSASHGIALTLLAWPDAQSPDGSAR